MAMPDNGGSMRRVRAALVLAFVLALPQAALLAHHSFAAEYDAEKPVTITGTVSRIEWVNPHIYVTLDVRGAGGQVDQWRMEGYPPNMLVRQGWRRDVTLKPGAEITITGWRSRIEPTQGAGRQVTFADGTKLWMGPPAGTGGQ
jgi:hypothetical protein